MFNNRGNILSSLPQVTKTLLIINAVVFLFEFFISKRLGLNLSEYFALHNFKTTYFIANQQYGFAPTFFKPIQVITHMFMHGSFSHIFFNMFGLVLFGRVLENVLGAKKFFILYFVSGLGSAFLQLGANYLQLNALGVDILQFSGNPTYSEFWRIMNDLNFDTMIKQDFVLQIKDLAQSWSNAPEDMSYVQGAEYFLHISYTVYANVPMVGASGAILGVLAAFAVMFPNVELMFIFIPVPIKAKYLVPFYAVAELFMGVANFQFDNVAHFAHLGGAIAGFILVMIWKKNQIKSMY